MKKKNKKKTVYKLYATRTTDSVINAVKTMKYARVTADYTLIYDSGKNITSNNCGSIDYTIIGDKEIDRLSAADKDWLMECNFAIIAEEALKNKELVLQNMTEALKSLEEELEKSQSKNAGSDDGEKNKSHG